ncbi:Heavy metal transport/detoxification protein [Polaromonas sp. JS666]|nr:Heavy metal transport/detoxification protein [Polaromonas sp. JS666]
MKASILFPRSAFMMEFDLQSMTCSHCVNAAAKAVKSAAPDAKVEVDLPNHKVSVETQVDRETVVAALSEAGYRPD